MADVQIVDLNPKLSPDGTELVEIQETAGGAGTSFSTPLSNLIGPPGQDGTDGADGAAATIEAGTTTTTAPGTNALVTNSGTSSSAVFDFDIPRGDVGAAGSDGADGSSATADAGQTTTLPPGSPATVTNVGTTQDAVFDFAIPQGIQGDTGANGADGADGADGVGMPAGGLTGQVATKASNTDYDIEWNTPAGGGDVIGPASAVDDNIATFNGITGKAIQDGGAKVSDFATSAQGALADTATQPADNISTLTNDSAFISDATATRFSGAASEGFVPDPLTESGRFLSDNGTWTSPAGGGDVTGVAPSVTGNLATYADTTGKVIDDVGVSPSDFATAAEGALAATATQPGDNVSTLNNDAGYTANAGDVVGPASAVDSNFAAFDTTTGKLIKDSGSTAATFATSAQGALADTATQPGDNVSTLNNDAGYTANAGDVVGPASAVDSRLAAFDTTTGKLLKDSGSLTSDFATSAQGATADTATQPGDNVSTLTNDAGYKAYFSGAVLPDPATYAEGDLFLVTG